MDDAKKNVLRTALSLPGGKLVLAAVLLDVINEGGEAPAGIMYAALMDVCDLESFQEALDILVKARLVEKRGAFLYAPVKKTP